MSDEQLPLRGYDELPVATLQHQIRSLTDDQLQQLLDHERAHGNRIPVIEVLRRRYEELENGATPTSGEHEPFDVPSHSASGSPVEPQGPAGKNQSTTHGTRSTTGQGIEHSE